MKREMTIFCVDVSSSMANLRTIDVGHSSEKTTQQITNLEYGLEVVKARVADMLIGGLKTVHCGIVLFGSDHTENSLADSGYEFIWEYMIPAQPTTATLKQIADIPSHFSQKHAPNKGDLLSALIFCDYLLGESLGKKKWTRKIVMITDAASETIWKGSKSQRDRMEKDDIELTVVGLDFDEPDIGYLEPNKSETKSENERRLYKLCRSLRNGSACVTALLAVPDAHLPRPHIPGTNPTPVTLSIGALDPEQVTEESYEPSHTLRIECHLRKCTTVVRPKSMKKMSRFGIKTEQAKIRRMNGPSTTGELIDHFMAEEDEEEEPLGLLQVERKYVYGPQEKPVKPKEQKARGVDSDSSSDDSDSSYDEAVPLREADKERLAKAYKYGATLVVIDDDDLEQIRESFDTSLQIRGFLRLTDVPRQHLLNDVNYLVANPTDGHGQLAFSAVVRALAIEGLIASARYVSRSVEAEPKMVVLFPMIEKDLLYFLMVQVPFAEDHREYFFPSLEYVRTRAGKQLDVHKNLPTEEMEHAMDDFVDALGADDEEDVKDEDGV
ncbi:hypothetical protein CROQUDRAFT_46048 [Cronartium quercuum f. sp. fusiforme G11]|uniref:DNA helicase n=1 Tax=Cronartium quercuum f. sp. fusiforme G11 TaxID=708437 RepID=A0A9P6TB28_9BASI|nr:hypothetical protein CROQUDRAFT_46048 [Cronartium quercuum f. sp. fusiforme G11]